VLPDELGTQWQACGCITVQLAAASGRRIGVLYAADKQNGEFTPNDERVLSQLADLAAVGLENAQLYAELEERVRKRTVELQESNKELEAFSYSVSHDLRGPLRAIAGFTGLLRDRHYETIDTDGRRYIDRVLAGTQRMSNLIDDLLELGRVTRVEFRRQQVDLSEYARATLARLREASPERAAAIVVEPQLIVERDAGLLEIVLENLLDNAWKFTAGRPVAEIRVGTLAIDGIAGNDERTFFVQDNGVGFDPRYATNLFGVFQRLHAAGEFPGTGVGLATVQRIVQRHGGRIRADAAVDRGATIYFSIAKGR
jgi:light-regulated signal transduction histidine kinase (bacteriophytochrome)